MLGVLVLHVGVLVQLAPQSDRHALFLFLFLLLEDVFIYLTAKYAEVDIFISENRELIKAIAGFECLTSEGFINKYLKIA